MSATNCPETPRQKMISMMYLVYTALLALNVSTDVLNGFSVVQKSLQNSIEITDAMNQHQLSNLEYQAEEEKKKGVTRAQATLVKANEAIAKSDSLANQIEAMKVRIIRICDNIEESVPDAEIKAENLQARDNLDKAYQVAEHEKYGEKLVASIINYGKYAVQIDSTLTETVLNSFDIEIGEDKSWSIKKMPNKETGVPEDWIVRNFEHMPAVAALTILTYYQQTVRNIEAQMLTSITSGMDASDVRVNKLEAFVIPESQNVTKGSQYKATIALAAIDTTQRPKITVNGTVLDEKTSIYVASCNSVGEFNVAGKIEIQKPDGKTAEYPFSTSYIVSEPNAIISADKMNVLYDGIDNPISVSVPGVASKNIVITADAKCVVKGNTATVHPNGGTSCTIKVSFKNAEGKSIPAGSKTFKIKSLPDPTAYIAYTDKGSKEKYTGLDTGSKGMISKGSLIANEGVGAELKDALIDAPYSVTSFEISVVGTMGTKKIKSKGNKFSSEQLSKIREMSSGKTFTISNIHAVGPDKKDRKLPPIEVVLK